MPYSYYYWCTLLLFCQAGFCLTPSEAYWECRIHDRDDKSWSAKSPFHRAALNMALDACKKESTLPASCVQTRTVCEGYNQIKRYRRPSGWRCTAFDRLAHAFHSPYSTKLDSAAFRAMKSCKKRSHVPYTCYLNYVTCGIGN